MSGSQIGGVIGGAIGYYFGGPSGAAWGYSIGAGVGSLVAPDQLPAQRGPRLDDLKIQRSEYGAPIPKLYGTVRMAGTVIDASDWRETEATVTNDGKGGPTQETATYSYDCDVAILLTDREIDGIRRIWANGRLIWDARTNGTTTSDYWSSLTVYRGTAAQLPDPTLEALHGAGNVPAYRGEAYVVIAGFKSAQFGNFLPVFEFEVVETGTPVAVADPVLLGTDSGTALIAEGGTGHSFAVAPGSAINAATGDDVLVIVAAGITVWDSGSGVAALADRIYDVVIDATDPEAARFRVFGAVSWPSRQNDIYAQYSASASLFAYKKYTRAEFNVGRSVGFAFNWTSEHPAGGASVAWGVVVYDGATFTEVNAISASAPVTTDSQVVTYSVTPDPGDFAHLLWGTQQNSPSSPTVTWPVGYSNAPDPNGTVSQLQSAVRRIVTGATTGGQAVGSVNSQLTPPATIWITGARLTNTATAGITPVDPTVGDVVRAICVDAGVPTGEVVTSGLDETIVGIVGAGVTARGMIEPLQRVGYFDCIVEDSKLRFPRRGGSVVATIGADDLGETKTDGAEIIATTQRQASELPDRITLRYQAPANDYQSGAQSSDSYVTGGAEPTTVEVPIALTDARAAEAAEFLFATAWVERNARAWSTSRAYANLGPGDVVALDNGGGRTLRVRITSRKESGPLVRWEGVDDRADVLDFNATAATGPIGEQTLPDIAPTSLFLLDAPLLRDADDTYGFYAAMASGNSGATWPGATLYRARDGVTYSPIVSVTAEAVAGVTATALGAWTGGNLVDEANTVEVVLYGSAAPASQSYADMIAGEAGVWMIGTELVQVRTVTLVSGRRYRLSGLLRGRMGTSSAAHATTEVAVLLDAATVRNVSAVAGDTGVSESYKAPTIRATLAGATARSFTTNAVRLKPLAPVHARAVKLSGDVRMEWIRQARVAYRWTNGIDVALDEASEAYEVRIYSGASVVRTISVTGATVTTYTAAQAVTDGVSLSTSLTWGVAQVSARVGAGYENKQTTTF